MLENWASAASYSCPMLHNIHVARHGRRWWLLDFEYAGLHDLDYLLAKLLTSRFKHTGLLTAPPRLATRACTSTPGSRHSVGRRLLTTPWLPDLFARLPADRERLAAHLLPLLYFRFTTLGDDPPTFGLTALVLSAHMVLGQR